MRNFDLWYKCMDCALCQGSRYQSPPLLGIFNGHDILVIGQNPGEATRSKPHHLHAASEMGVVYTAEELSTIYEQDFKESYAYTVGMSKLLGERWLDRFDFTNAVRCRTPGNAQPSEQMQTVCKLYTSTLIHDYKGVIFVGAVAARQFNLGLSRGVVRRGKTGRYYLYIPHYAAREVDYENAQQCVRQLQHLVKAAK